jgi:hypothetical protein
VIMSIEEHFSVIVFDFLRWNNLQTQRETFIDILLSGFDINSYYSTTEEDGCTLLSWLCKYKPYENNCIIITPISYHMNIKPVGWQERKSLVKLLLKCGADPLKCNKAGETAIQCAEMNHCNEIAKLLKRHIRNCKVTERKI